MYTEARQIRNSVRKKLEGERERESERERGATERQRGSKSAHRPLDRDREGWWRRRRERVGLETLKATRHEPLRSYLSDVLPRSRLVKVNQLHELISRQTAKGPWLATRGGMKGFQLPLSLGRVHTHNRVALRTSRRKGKGTCLRIG